MQDERDEKPVVTATEEELVTEPEVITDPDETEVVKPDETASKVEESASEEETPEAKAHRLEIENARLQGRLEALAESAAKPEPEKSVTEEFDTRIDALTKERDALVSDADLDDEATKQATKDRRAEVNEKLLDLTQKRQRAIEQAEERAANQDAHEGVLRKALKDAELPPSAFGALDKAVRTYFAREGFTQNRPPSLAHYQTRVELEALKLKAVPKPAPKPTPKPSVGPGGGEDPALAGIKPGNGRSWVKQMRALGYK